MVGWFHYCYSHDGARANAAQLARSVYSQISIRDGESGDFALVCMACLMSHALAVGERSLGGRMNERAEDLRFSVWRGWRDCWIVSHADGGRKVG